MSTLYIKSEMNLGSYNSNKFDIRINQLADSYDNSSTDILYEVNSNIVTDNFIKDTWLKDKGTFISKMEAHVLGKELQPDRTLQDIEGNDYEFSFSLLELTEAQALRKAELDVKTYTLIVQGFTYNGDLFGAEPLDQANWSSISDRIDMEITKKQLTGLTLQQAVDAIFPIHNEVKTYDGEWYTLNDYDHYFACYTLGIDFVNGYRTSHKEIKDQIEACTTVEEVIAIEDNRV